MMFANHAKTQDVRAVHLLLTHAMIMHAHKDSSTTQRAKNVTLVQPDAKHAKPLTYLSV